MGDKERKSGFVTDPDDLKRDAKKRKGARRPLCSNATLHKLQNGRIGGNVNDMEAGDGRR